MIVPSIMCRIFFIFTIIFFTRDPQFCDHILILIYFLFKRKDLFSFHFDIYFDNIKFGMSFHYKIKNKAPDQVNDKAGKNYKPEAYTFKGKAKRKIRKIACQI